MWFVSKSNEINHGNIIEALGKNSIKHFNLNETPDVVNARPSIILWLWHEKYIISTLAFKSI